MLRRMGDSVKKKLRNDERRILKKSIVDSENDVSINSIPDVPYFFE